MKRKGGGFWIEAANGGVLLYVYPQRENNPEWKKPSEDEGREIVQAIANVETQAQATAPSLGTLSEKAPLVVTAYQPIAPPSPC